jgi:aromatic-L-amino-acid decarboxylase
LARELEAKIAADSRLELVAPVPFGLVCFRHREGNEATDSLAATINASGDVVLTPSKLGDTSFLRVSIGQTGTTTQHVDRLWGLIDDNAFRS